MCDASQSACPRTYGNPKILELDFVLQINSGPLLSAVITQASQWCEEFHLEKVRRWPDRCKDILEFELP